MKIKRVLYHIRRHCYRFVDYFAFSKEFDLSNAVAVYGPPRSGTTWFIDVLNKNPEFLTVFEPLFDSFFPELSPRFKGRPFLELDAKDEEYRESLTRIFVGKSEAYDPIIRMSSYDILKRFKADRLLLKFVRGNRLIPWMSKNFDFSRSYLILRHPCSLISSQLQSGFYGYGWETNLTKDMILDEAAEMSFLEKELITKIGSISSIEEVLAVMYGLDYMVPLRLAGDSVTPVFYEDLVLDPETGYSKIFTDLGAEDYIESALARVGVASATTKSSEKEILSDAGYQVRKWKDRLTEKQVKDIARVLEWFDIEFSLDGYRVMGLETKY